MTPIDPQQQVGRTGRPARRFRIGMEPMARAVLAEQERDEAEAKLQAAEQRADALAVSLAETREALAAVIRPHEHNLSPHAVWQRAADLLAADPDQRAKATISAVQAALAWAQDRGYLEPGYADEDYPGDALWTTMIDALGGAAGAQGEL